MSNLTSTPEAFTVQTCEGDGFHYVYDETLGARVAGPYPLKKTANRRARQMSDAAPARQWPAHLTDEQKAAQLAHEDAGCPLPFPGAVWDGSAYVGGPIAPPADEPAAPILSPSGQRALDQMAADRLAEEAAEARSLALANAEALAAREALDATPLDTAISVAKLSVSTSNPSEVQTREDWLNAAAVLISQVLADRADIELPAYRVTCGWPSKGGTAKKRVIGQCWNPDASSDAHAEVFISPMESDPVTVVAILAHELIHAGLPKGTGHKGPFVKAAKAIGFLAPFTQLKTSPDLDAWAQEIVNALPDYPHARLNPSAEGDKKTQTTRMIKATCEEDGCGYTVRLTRKWIDSVGAPHCPIHGVMTCEGVSPVDGPEGEDEDGGEG